MVNQEKDKKFVIIFGVVFAISLAVFIWIFVSINNRFKSASDLGLLAINTKEEVVPNDTKEASSTQDKSIGDMANKIINQMASGKTANVTASTTADSESEVSQDTVQTAAQEDVVTNEPETKKELSFMAPCVGEIITDYADESLVYSKTLDEWTTHFGIDIKANKTSAVVAAERGTVKSIKTDPRYGLTVIISHDDGYETLYANLLAADFVKEGDTVSKNQTIGTIGESASFEVSDPPHLHFEILLNGENVNPTTLIK